MKHSLCGADGDGISLEQTPQHHTSSCLGDAVDTNDDTFVQPIAPKSRSNL